MKNLKHFFDLVDRECPNYKVYEYYIWWPKEVYLYNLVYEKFGVKLTRNQVTKYLNELRKEKGDPNGSPNF